MSIDLNKRKTIIIYLLILVILMIAVKQAHFKVPLHRDEGIYAYIAQTALRGKTPILDAIDHKTPLLYYVYSVPLLIFGFNSPLGIRVMALFLWIMMTLAVFFIVKNLFPDRKSAPYFASLFMFFSSISISNAAFFLSTELVGQTFILFSILFFSFHKRKKSGLFVFLSGLMWASAVLCRQTYLLMGIVYPLFDVFDGCEGETRKEKLTYFFKDALIFTGGAVTAGVLTCLQLGLKNCGPIIELLVYYNKVIAAASVTTFNFSLILELFRLFFNENPLLTTSALTGTILIFFIDEKVKSWFKWVAGAWLIMGFVAIAAGTVYFPRNLNQIIPILCIMGGFFLNSFFTLAKKREKLKPIFFMLVIAGSLYSLYQILPVYFDNRPLVKLSEGIHGKLHGRAFVNSYRLAEYLRKNTKEDDSIYIWGNEWQVYFLTGRPAATRHISHNFFLRSAAAIHNKNLPIKETFIQHQKELGEDLKKNRPRYIIVTAPFVDFNMKEYILPRIVYDFLRNNYEPVTDYKDEIFGASLFRLKDENSGEESK